MNSSIYKRQSILLGTTVICAVFALISITWAAFSSTLNVSGKATVSAQSWDIDFTNTVNTKWTAAQKLTGAKENLAELPASTDTTAFSLPKDQEASGFLGTLSMSGDKITYTWYVQNFGTFDATYSLNGVIATSTYASGSNVDITCNTSDNSTDKTFCNNYVKTLVTIDGVTATPTSTFTLAKAGETGDHATVVLTIEITGENQIYTGTLANMNQNTSRVKMLSNNLTMLSSSNGDLDISVKSLSIASEQNVATTKKAEEVVTTTVPNECQTLLLDSNKTKEFDYINGEATYTITCPGTYQIETWGAQGGNARINSYYGNGGYGAYATGTIKLSKGDTLYINVGGQGQSIDNGTTSNTYGYNGGGYAGYASGNSSNAGGGGATSITFTTGVLKNHESLKGTYDESVGTYISTDVIIVAAGGGGGYCHTASNQVTGGHAGGISGSITTNLSNGYGYGLAGTQTTAGGFVVVNNEHYTYPDNQPTISSSFGQGQAYSSYQTSSYPTYPGGGGGFYGGGAGHHNAGGGGSSYIGNSSLTNKSMYCYNCTESNAESTKTVSTTNVSSTATSNYAKQGNGYAKITYVSYGN